MTRCHSEFPHDPIRSETGAGFSTNGSTSANQLPHHTFAKNAVPAGHPPFRYREASAATGASTTQVVSGERSTARATASGPAISHCEVTEWHRSVICGMRKGNASRPQRRGGSDDRRH